MDKMVLSAPTDFIYDKCKDGWKLLSDVPHDGNPTLELAEFLHDDESHVNGEVMLSRATELELMAGQRHAERMLGQVGQIPESWRTFVLVFPGTVWRDTHGRSVPFLDWTGDEWHLYWGWLDNGWFRNGRLVSLCK